VQSDAPRGQEPAEGSGAIAMEQLGLETDLRVRGHRRTTEGRVP
jgi:hypothetical protein